MAGGAIHVDRVAVAVLPMPPLVEFTVTTFVPFVVLVTSNEKVHDDPGASVPPVSVADVELAAAVSELPVPQGFDAG